MSIFPGLYSHRIGDGQLVVPRKVNHLGEHISHDLTHHWSDDEEEEEIGLLGLANKRRRRRAVGDPAADALHYQLELNNETLHIELEYSIEHLHAHCLLDHRHSGTGNINSCSIFSPLTRRSSRLFAHSDSITRLRSVPLYPVCMRCV